MTLIRGRERARVDSTPAALTSYATPVRAVVVGSDGEAALADVAEPDGPGELVRVVACGLCGSDVEKLTPAYAGTVLGHEVSADLEDGRRVALVHHAPCGECERCRAGHESTCAPFAEPTIRPGGLAERARAASWVELPADWPAWRGTVVEPLACVLRGAARVPRGRVLIVGNGFVGRLFGAVLARRGDEVFAVDLDPRRAGRAPDGAVDAAVLCGPGGVETALDAVEPGGTVLVFADAGRLPLGTRLPPRVGGRRGTVGDAAVHGRGGRAAPRARRPRADGAAARAASPTGWSSTAGATRSRSSSRRARADPPRPGRPPARDRPGSGARRGRRAPPGGGRADRRHRPEGVPARATPSCSARCRARSATRSAGSTSPRDAGSSPPTPRRAAPVRRALEDRRRSASGSSPSSTARTRSSCSSRSGSRAGTSSPSRPVSHRRSPRSPSRSPAASTGSTRQACGRATRSRSSGSARSG